MNKETYIFHKKVLYQPNSSGSIFDPTEIQLNGNTFNTNTDDEVVLGFFSLFTQCKKKNIYKSCYVTFSRTIQYLFKSQL